MAALYAGMTPPHIRYETSRAQSASHRVVNSLCQRGIHSPNFSPVSPSSFEEQSFNKLLETMSDVEDIADGELPVIDPYEILELERSATTDQVKSAYRKAALKNHPGKLRSFP
jgi:DnaJ-domain-containing protein 1